jgi:hypothetical protein
LLILESKEGEPMKEETRKKIDEKKIEKIQKGEDCEIGDIPQDMKVEGKPSPKDLKKIQNSK